MDSGDAPVSTVFVVFGDEELLGADWHRVLPVATFAKLVEAQEWARLHGYDVDEIVEVPFKIRVRPGAALGDRVFFAIAFDNEVFGLFEKREDAEQDLKRQIQEGGPAWDGCKVEEWIVQRGDDG